MSPPSLSPFGEAKGVSSSLEEPSKAIPIINNTAKAFMPRNDLLNYQVLGSPPSHPYSMHVTSSQSSLRSRQRHAALSSAQYIWANFRFICRPGQSPLCRPTTCNGNVAELNWHAIEQVLIPAADPPCCPICLCTTEMYSDSDTMVLPKITQCGHVFCWPCLLQTFTFPHSVTDGNKRAWTRCPICFQDVHLKHLKSVSFYPVRPAHLGEERRFVLLRRGIDGTVQAVDRDGEWLPKVQHWPLQRILDEVVAPEGRLLCEKPLDPPALQPLAEQLLAERISALEGDIHAGGNKSVTEDASVSSSPSSSVYFHQAEDGAPVLLDALCIRIMKQHFGNYRSFPAVLTAPILSIEHVSMNAETARRYRHLSHLPPGLTVALCHVDLDGIVPEEILQGFRPEIARIKSRHETATSIDGETTLPLQAPSFIGSNVGALQILAAAEEEEAVIGCHEHFPNLPSDASSDPPSTAVVVVASSVSTLPVWPIPDNAAPDGNKTRKNRFVLLGNTHYNALTHHKR